MVSPAMEAAMIGTMYLLRANCAQHGGSASSGGLISAYLLKLQGSNFNQERKICSGSNTRESALTNLDSIVPLPDVKWIPLQLRSKIIMQRKVIQAAPEIRLV